VLPQTQPPLGQLPLVKSQQGDSDKVVSQAVHTLALSPVGQLGHDGAELQVPALDVQQPPSSLALQLEPSQPQVAVVPVPIHTWDSGQGAPVFPQTHEPLALQVEVRCELQRVHAACPPRPQLGNVLNEQVLFVQHDPPPQVQLAQAPSTQISPEEVQFGDVEHFAPPVPQVALMLTWQFLLASQQPFGQEVASQTQVPTQC
jgi:hypothetical protein